MVASQTHRSGPVAVIGGGLVALCSALYLERSGRAVTVLERATVGSGASRGNGGQIVTADPLPAPGMVREGLRHWFSPSSAFYIHPRSLPALAPFLIRFARSANERSYLESFRALDRLNRAREMLFDELAEIGIGSHFQPTGNLKTFREHVTARREWEAAGRLAELGLSREPGEFLDEDGLRALEPSLGPAARWGFLRPDVRFGDPSAFVDQLRAHLTERDVTLREGARVVGLQERGAAVRVAQDDTEEEYDQVLIAAGMGSPSLLRSLGVRLPLVAGIGYSFTVRPSSMPRYTVLLGEAHVGATPLDSERLRIAGTMELGARPGANADARISAIARAAGPFLDGVDWAQISDRWAGSRPMTPDGLPYIGRVTGCQRVFVATGHNMLGLSLAPATGHEIARLMTGAGAEDALAPFAIDR